MRKSVLKFAFALMLSASLGALAIKSLDAAEDNGGKKKCTATECGPNQTPCILCQSNIASNCSFHGNCN